MRVLQVTLRLKPGGNRIGPYAEERPTIERLHDYIDEQGYERRGKHHEIYLSDPRRTAPEKLKTVVRQGMG